MHIKHVIYYLLRVDVLRVMRSVSHRYQFINSKNFCGLIYVIYLISTIYTINFYYRRQASLNGYYIICSLIST